MLADLPKTDSIPPMPNSPDHPEKVPSNIPIPGEPTPSGERKAYKCKVCGRIFESKVELDVHLEDHNYPLEKTNK